LPRIIGAWIGRTASDRRHIRALLDVAALSRGGVGAMGMGLPSAITGFVPGLLLFYLLAADLFITSD